jgi:hypothetical protein
MILSDAIPSGPGCAPFPLEGSLALLRSLPIPDVAVFDSRCIFLPRYPSTTLATYFAYIASRFSLVLAVGARKMCSRFCILCASCHEGYCALHVSVADGYTLLPSPFRQERMCIYIAVLQTAIRMGKKKEVENNTAFTHVAPFSFSVAETSAPGVPMPTWQQSTHAI